MHKYTLVLLPYYGMPVRVHTDFTSLESCEIAGRKYKAESPNIIEYFRCVPK